VEVHQFATSLTYGDAISDEMLEIQKILRERGYNSEIFIRFYDPRMAGFIKDYREYREFSSPRNVVIFHFSIGSPVSKMFFRVPDKKIMIYHNITPFEHYLDSHRILTRECYKGRLEIKLFVDKVDLALGDSEFNRQELEEVGYAQTGVLPLLLDFTKFDREGDSVTEQIFANGKITLLFVGRLIPNKKYEDILKVFYFYKKYFNRNSQLLLVGDYRGLERYLTGLLNLVKKLELTDVYFTGHVEFKELISFYRLSHLYLSLSEHEGFGVPLLEAFHTRVPVVSYAAGAVEETLNGGGIILRSKDLLKTAALIDTIMKDNSLRGRIISSQVKALDKYQKENISRILLRHIEKVKKG
jgi:glycosyltransferase involved in cell wall biosynthesis